MAEARPERASPRETAFFALSLVGVTIVVAFIADAGVLFTRPFWVDELLTVFVAGHASPVTVLGDLGNGADGGASLFHLSVWALQTVGVPLAPFALRMMSLFCVLGALLLVFIVLRRVFPSGASAAGSLAVGANALVVAHSYEARFYGPWLLCCTLVAWLLTRRQEQVRSGRVAVALGAAAFALCTIHFYGLISLGLMVAAVVAGHGRRWRDGVQHVAPASAGLLSLLIIVPLALAQREAYTVPSWIPDFTVSQLAGRLGEFWQAIIPVFAAAAIVTATVVRSGRDGGRMLAALTQRSIANAGILSLASLALMPLAMALLSIAGQPSMISRYAIAASLAWGPWIALATALSGRWIARVAVVALVWLWFVAYVRESRAKIGFARSVAQSRQVYEQARAMGQGLPIVFPSMQVMYPVLASDSGRGSGAAFLEIADSAFNVLFPDSTPLGQRNRGAVLERDLARVHAVRFGFPRLATHMSLDTTARFLLLAPAERLPVGFSGPEHFASVLFPRHRITRLLPELSLLERRPTSPASN